MPYGSNFATILDYFISRLKKVAIVEWSFGGWGHVLVAVVERVNQESIYELYVRRKVAVRSCREVAVVERCLAVGGGSTV